MRPTSRLIHLELGQIGEGVIRAIPDALRDIEPAVDRFILRRRIGELVHRGADHVEVDCGQSIKEATQLMLNGRVDMVTVHKSGLFVGILCSTEIRKAVVAESTSQTAEQAMIAAKKVVCINADATIRDALMLLDSHPIKRLVVKNDAKVIGVLTVGRLLRWIGSELMALSKGP